MIESQREVVVRVDALIVEAKVARKAGDTAKVIEKLTEAKKLIDEFALPFFGFGELIRDPEETFLDEGTEEEEDYEDSSYEDSSEDDDN